MLTFKGDPQIKESLIARMDKHIELDELVPGETGYNGKGGGRVGGVGGKGGGKIGVRVGMVGMVGIMVGGGVSVMVGKAGGHAGGIQALCRGIIKTIKRSEVKINLTK